MIMPGMPMGAAPKITHGRFKGQDKVFMGLELQLEITYNADMRKIIGKRNQNKVLRRVNRAVMLYWHKTFRKKHFTRRALSEYRYKRRTPTTYLIKRLQYGHSEPIVSKGIAKSMTRTVKFARATPTTGRLAMYGPWYLAQRAKRKDGTMGPDLQSELTSVSLKDAKQLAVFGGDILRNYIKQDKRRRLGAQSNVKGP